jgi:hypothetical protein
MTEIKSRMGDVEPGKAVPPPVSAAHAAKIPKHISKLSELSASAQASYLCQRFMLSQTATTQLQNYVSTNRSISYEKIKQWLKDSPVQYSENFIENFFESFKEPHKTTADLIRHLIQLDDIFHNLAILSLNGKSETENYNAILSIYQKSNLNSNKKITLSKENWEYLIADKKLTENEEALLLERLNIDSPTIKANELSQILNNKESPLKIQRQLGLLKLLRKNNLAGIQEEKNESYALPYKRLYELFNPTQGTISKTRLMTLCNHDAEIIAQAEGKSKP